MDDIILEVKGLTKKFAGLTAVNNLNFQVRRNLIHALIGPNGAGKTTTVNMITGVHKPTEGDVLFKGQSLLKMEPYQRAQMGIGRTYQNIKLFNTMTTKENLMMGAQAKTGQNVLKYLLNPKKANEEEKMFSEKADEILNFIGMYHLKDTVVSNLPYGRQKMAELGRTLMTEPSLILLDEPAAGLNPTERAEFVDIIQKVYEQGVDMFLIEHNMDVVMNLSHDITVLNFGSLIAFGTPEEIQNNDDVITAYLGEGYRQQQKKGVNV